VGQKKGGMTREEVQAYLGARFMEKFNDWIAGQTCPVLPGGKTGFYKWDVERFADAILERKPTYFD